MTLQEGTQLGPYQIVVAIGAGGMGEVYRARDTRLDRSVAIKVLPQHLSQQPELRERFEREARTISALNHPNICVLHDVGRQDGFDYLVMEYLEGETLAKRLEKGPLPVDQVQMYSIQIADALDRAHRQGITHRDLKPGNIMITASGAKLLDFGLAKFRQAEKPLAGSQSVIPTQASQLTMQGTILGTLQYMSPEQLEGNEADARTDLFALGGVMYEMLTGRKAFEGKSQASLIAAIIHVDPPSASLLVPVTPPALDRIVRKCLAKDPNDRWQTAKDLMDELRWISEPSSSPSHTVPPSAAKTSKRQSRWSIVLAGLFLLTTLTLATVILLHREPKGLGMIRMAVDPPGKNSFMGGAPAPQFAISADGRMLAFSATENAKILLWVRPFDSPTSQPLTETAGAQLPFWSPDGRYIGFFANSALKKVAVSGGVPLTLASVQEGGAQGGTWNQDGTILFSAGISETRGISRVSDNGGNPVPVTTVDEKREVGHVFPQFLPDGRHFVYLALGKSPEASGLYVASLDGGAPKMLVQTLVRGAYASGYLLYMRENVLMAQPFDPRRLELSGEPVRVTDQVASNTGNGRAAFGVSDAGMLVYRTGVAGGLQQLVWFDRQGKQSIVQTDAAQYRTHDLSLDGKRVAAHRHEPSSVGGDIWIVELDRNLTTRFTFGSSHNVSPIWSPDGTKLAYSSAKAGATILDLYQKIASGAASEDLLLKTQESKQAVDWSRDGRFILYESNGGQNRQDLWVLPLFGDKKPIPFLTTRFRERKGRFSPDGKWIAYTSDESGTDQVYIQPFPPNGGKWQISTKNGFEPRWRADGKELYYLDSSAETKLMAVSIKWSSRPESATPQELFTIGASNYGVDQANQYVASPDGQRFLLIRDIGPSAPNESISVLVNWPAGLKR